MSNLDDLFFFLFFKILFITESEHQCDGGGSRGRSYWAGSPMWRLMGVSILGPWDHDLNWRQMLKWLEPAKCPRDGWILNLDWFFTAQDSEALIWKVTCQRSLGELLTEPELKLCQVSGIEEQGSCTLTCEFLICYNKAIFLYIGQEISTFLIVKIPKWHVDLGESFH